MDQYYQLVYFPYITLRGIDCLEFGDISVVNFEGAAAKIKDEGVRKKVAAILAMHCTPTYGVSDARPIKHIGILQCKEEGFRRLTQQEMNMVQEFRHMIFLACLSKNIRLAGENVGSYIYTAENFDFVTQNFTLESDVIAETSGAIVSITIAGYKIDKTRFPKPSYVNQPLSFHYDEVLFKQLKWLRQSNKKFYRRIMRAGEAFIQSYYNTPAVDINARILLQAQAFEILLDLPEVSQRKHFKDNVERLCDNTGDRKFRYKYEKSGGKTEEETRSAKVLWADRFYTLRNHVIHGEVVTQKEYLFRNAQRHFHIAPIFFIFMIKRLIDECRKRGGKKPIFYERIDWRNLSEEEETKGVGFMINDDFYLKYALER